VTKPPASIDAYLAKVPEGRRRALEKVRKTIHSLLPGVDECISYSMPAFRYAGKVVAGFQATSKGCSYYPFSGTTLATLSAELGGYEQTKSALHFAQEASLSPALVRKLLAARLAEIDERMPSGAARAKPKTVRRSKQSKRSK